jgi:hypothetical protein
MALFTAFVLSAAAVAQAPVHVPTRAVAVARASARIVRPARVTLSTGPQPDGHKLQAATVTVEDGSRRPARLVEFQ